MLLWNLFQSFLIIGFISFGGGYAMIPVIESEVSKHGWMTIQTFTDLIAIAGMAPGPIATNSAILVGYSTAGISGAIVATIGILLPAFLIVLLVATLFRKLNHYPLVQSMFYGLRPIVTSLIIFAALKFALSNNLISLHISWYTISLLIIFGLSLFALLKLRMHPLFVIFLSGVAGAVIYS
ncbi:chromate transporter [Bacillus sp. JJ722]|uniref:chromate transporter n=1 Tax=Bacillus sp. JJ722 TaxID=3122973 RepID=UPI002FFF836C